MSLWEVLPVRFPLEKRQVLRWEKDEDRLPEMMMERTAAESLFPKEGPIDAKNLDWAIEVLTRETKRPSRSEYRRGRMELAEKGRRMI